MRKLSEHKFVFFFLPISLDICLVNQKNRLIETILLIIHIISFGGKIRKIVFKSVIKNYTLLP